VEQVVLLFNNICDLKHLKKYLTESTLLFIKPTPCAALKNDWKANVYSG
jgi:hypothetical protein